MLATITFYGFVLFVHIAAVVVAFGVTFTYIPIFSITRSGYERQLPYLHHVQSVVGGRIIGPVAGVILLAGLYLGIKGPYDFSEPWIVIGLVVLVALLATGGAYFGPRETRLAELAARDVEANPEGRVRFSAEYEQLFRQVRAVTLVANVLVLLVIFLMVTKP